MAPMYVDTRAPMRPQAVRVAEVCRELDDVVTLRLSGDRPLPFQPGQFNMLYAFGVGEVAISISGDPARPDDLLHTVRSVGAVSRALSSVRRGDTLGLRGPFGTHWPVEGERGRHLLFVAGGLGLAPLRPAIYRALAAPDLYSGITLIVGARSPRDILYPYQLAGWGCGKALDLHLTVDHAGPEWTGSVGVVTQHFRRALDGVDPARVSVFLCGPEVMMRYGCAGLAELGVGCDRMWLSMERNMKCALGHCGHCQFGADFVCRDGPVFRADAILPRMAIREV